MKNEREELNFAIIALQEKSAIELSLLKEQLQTTYESLNIIDLIKSTFEEVSSSKLTNNILGNAIGVGTGALAKKLLIGNSNDPTKNLFGTMVQFTITNVVTKYAGGIKSLGENLLYWCLKRRKESNR